MSGHATRTLALLREAESEGVDVEADATLAATIEGIIEIADDLEALRTDGHPALDGPLADCEITLRQLAALLDDGVTDPDALRERMCVRGSTTAGDTAAFESAFAREGEEDV